MAMVDPEIKVEFEDKEEYDEKTKAMKTVRVKVVTKKYQCRPEVLQRKKWMKFDNGKELDAARGNPSKH